MTQICQKKMIFYEIDVIIHLNLFNIELLELNILGICRRIVVIFKFDFKGVFSMSLGKKLLILNERRLHD